MSGGLCYKVGGLRDHRWESYKVADYFNGLLPNRGFRMEGFCWTLKTEKKFHQPERGKCEDE